LNRDLVISPQDSWDVVPHIDAYPGPARDPQSGIGMARLLHILSEWRALIIAAAVIGLLAGVALALLTTPMYRANVVMEVNPPAVEVVDDNTRSSGPTIDTWQFVATQRGLLQSRGLAEHVAQDLGLANNPEFADQSADPAARVQQAAAKIAKNLEIAPQSDGELIRFGFIWPDPEMTSNVANAYADAFINTSLQRRYEASAYARNFLQKQIAKTRSELEKSERQLVQYAQQQGIIDTSSGTDRATDAASPQGQSLVALNQALADATAKRVAAEGAYREALSAGVTTEVAASTEALRQQRAKLEADYQSKRAFLKPSHPDMVALQAQITALDKEISRETAGGERSRANTARAEYLAAVSAEQALQGKVAGLKSQVLNLRGRSIQYAILQRDVDTNRALYDALLQRYKQIGVAGGIGASPVSIVDRADRPTAPFKPNIVLNLIVGLALGLLAGIGLAVTLDILNDTIRTPSDVRNKLGMAFLASIPKRLGSSKRRDLLEELDDPGSPAAEAYATLGTSLRFTTDEGVPDALLVTSARAGEGKSSTALALAHHFAQLGKRVLLVDSDLRKPSFRGSGNQKGLSALLTSDEDLSDHVTATTYDNLWLLQCGPEPPNPAALLSGSRFKAIMSEATSHFDIVVVDSPPLLGLADAPLLAATIPAVVMVVESGKTRTAAAVDGIHRLLAAGANILGVTLTKTGTKHSGYGYPYGYGYGYGREANQRYGAIKQREDMISLITRSEGE
jgi:capsular exopolysaccharide synthesis family protein